MVTTKGRTTHLKASAMHIVAAALGLLISAGHAFAATPEQTVKEIVDKIKAAASPAPIIEYVDWEGAYGNIPAEQRAMMKVNSSDEMKGLYRRILEDPVAAMKERMKEQMAQLPADQQTAAEQQIVHMEQMIGQQKAKMTEQIKETQYDIGKATVTGETASVQLTQSFQGQKREENIPLVKKGDKWLLSSMDMFKPKAGPPAGGPSAGGPSAGKPMMPMPPQGGEKEPMQAPK